MSDQLGGSIGSEHTHTPGRDQELRYLRARAARAIPTWRRDGADWVLLAGRRRFGRVVADSKYPGMSRSTLSGGRLSDMTNLAWAKNAVLAAAERELEWEARQKAAIAPPKCPEKWGVFEGSAPPIAPNDLAATPLAEPLQKTPSAGGATCA
jgi:hypothetical protein